MDFKKVFNLRNLFGSILLAGAASLAWFNRMKLKDVFTGKNILIAGGVLFFIYIIMIISPLSTFMSVFAYLNDKVSGWTGLNMWYANALAISIAVIIALYGSWLFSINRYKKTTAFVLVALIGVSFCLWMGMDYDSRYFDNKGNPAKCVAKDVYDHYVEVSCNQGDVHRDWGTEVKQMTPEIAREMKLRNSTPLKIERVVLDLNTVLFTPSGISLYWYYKYPDGRLEFFKEGGRHPAKNVPLIPVDTEIAELLHKYLKEGQFNMIIGNENGSEKTDYVKKAKPNDGSFSALMLLKDKLTELGRN